eukprot:INCI19051.16.p2 GENE.INCI19051.16~~INCI19051.16.p2  ORF type:complete len:115 (+),score=4.29 INCI19051.16:499-843(+)
MRGEDAARGGQGRRSGPVRPPLATATPAGTSASTGPAASASASTGLTSSPSASTGLTPPPSPAPPPANIKKFQSFLHPSLIQQQRNNACARQQCSSPRGRTEANGWRSGGGTTN